eukprot:CAMPEP_0168338370 /NCGR_PEP_ID=MMETSP0213-20121227/12789_1 /TAXON_ID=151035 /ORGANISM="Euplotes harpa, Strain FSP1.4" /LENGTH=350 /DNA_ID=CAMNT_0008344125 /DNA_START=25 /DNA_END=1077 /DNA_ORIENTATION=+
MKAPANLICSIVVFMIVVSFSHAADNGKCYGLVLQGGGDKAAYQAGVMSGLLTGLAADLNQYDVITGVGIGGINGAILAAHKKGDEKAAATELTNFWKTIKDADVYQNWSWGGPVRGLLFKSSLYDSSPFRVFLSKNIKKPVRYYQVSATDASTGAMKVWDETTDLQTLVKAIGASAAYPGFFEPISDIDDKTYYDGATSFSINIGGAINKCKSLGFKESDIVLDIILNSAATIKDKDTSGYTSIPMLIRYLEIRLFYDSMDLLERAKDGFRTVQFRYTIAPTQKLDAGLLPFSFNQKQIQNMYSLGQKDARDAIARGVTVSTEDICDYTNKKIAHTFRGDYADYLDEKY